MISLIKRNMLLFFKDKTSVFFSLWQYLLYWDCMYAF